MKRKIVTLLSIVLLCGSICACGEDNSSSRDTRDERDESSIQSVLEGSEVEEGSSVIMNENNEDTEQLAQNNSEGSGQPERYRYNEDGVVAFTQEEFAQYIKVVEINLDNWSEYFCDFKYENNEYGSHVDIGFGLKPEYIGRVDDVELKFNGRIDYNEDGSIHSIYDGASGVMQSYIGDKIVEFEDRFEYHTPDFWTLNYQGGTHYTQFECLDADGQLYLFDIPDDVEEYVVEGWETYYNFKKAPYTDDIPSFKKAQEAYETYR